MGEGGMTQQSTLRAPFPWFGGKSGAAALVWERLGKVDNIVDAFCGSAAFVLGYPFENQPTITMNDVDGFVSNFFRAVTSAPDEVASWLDFPVSEIDLFARHVWLIKQRNALVLRLQTDPEYYDAKIAGWWCWGACAWIGTGWCSGEGPWIVEDGEIINRQLPHLGNAGQGVNRKLPHLVYHKSMNSAIGSPKHNGCQSRANAVRIAVPPFLRTAEAGGFLEVSL